MSQGYIDSGLYKKGLTGTKITMTRSVDMLYVV